MVLDTRATLLEKSLTLFAARGYDAVGVQEIVAAAGVTKPTLYHYFGSKYGLLEALLEERLTPFQRDLAAAAAYDGDLTGTLAHVVQLYLQFAGEHPTFFRMQRSMSYAPPDSEAFLALAPHQQEQKRTLEQIFIDAVPQHGNLRGRHQLYALTLLGTIFSVLAYAQSEGIPADQQLADLTVKQFMYGIYAL